MPRPAAGEGPHRRPQGRGRGPRRRVILLSKTCPIPAAWPPEQAFQFHSSGGGAVVSAQVARAASPCAPAGPRLKEGGRPSRVAPGGGFLTGSNRRLVEPDSPARPDAVPRQDERRRRLWRLFPASATEWRCRLLCFSAYRGLRRPRAPGSAAPTSSPHSAVEPRSGRVAAAAPLEEPPPLPAKPRRLGGSPCGSWSGRSRREEAAVGAGAGSLRGLKERQGRRGEKSPPATRSPRPETFRPRWSERAAAPAAGRKLRFAWDRWPGCYAPRRPSPSPPGQHLTLAIRGSRSLQVCLDSARSSASSRAVPPLFLLLSLHHLASAALACSRAAAAAPRPKARLAERSELRRGGRVAGSRFARFASHASPPPPEENSRTEMRREGCFVAELGIPRPSVAMGRVRLGVF